MAVDKNKIIAEATKLVQKGALDKAIKTYERIVAEDPKDVRILLKIGELHQKKGDEKAAAGAFQKVADTYADQGFFLKSVAVYKQIAKLDPEDVRVNERLAGLYQQLGLLSDAMGQLQAMAAAHEKAGDAARLTDVLKRMVELDPDNIASSIKLGELHQRASQAGPALECFKRAADYLKKHNRADEYLKVAERVAALQPDDLALTRELAHIYLAKGDTKRALAKLQLCFKADPKEIGTLTLLAQAFRDLGQTTKTLSVYKELARVHEESGRAGDARSVWRKVQELAPDDADAAQALGAPPAPAAVAPPPPPSRTAPPPGPPPGVRAPPPGPPPGVAAPRPAPPPAPGRSSAPPPGRPPGVAPAAPPPAPAPRPAPAAPPPPPPPASGGAEAIPKLLTETDVYVKYGLLEKALQHLEKVLQIDPGSVAALEKARDIHEAAGRLPEAFAAGERAVRAAAAQNDHDRARDALARLRHLDPRSPALAPLAAALGGTEEVSLEPADLEALEAEDGAPEVVEPEAITLDPVDAPELAPEPLPAPGDDDALALAAARAEDAEGEAVVDDEPAPAPAPVRRAPPGPWAAGGLDAAGDALAEAAAAISSEAEEIVEEAPPPPGRPAPPPPGAAARAAAPPPAAAPAARARAAPPVPGSRPAPPAPAPARAAPPPAAIAPPPPPRPAAPAPPEPDEDEVDLSDELEEADFFVEQGLLDDAREALRNLAAFYPGHPGVAQRLAQLERRAAPRPAAAAPSAGPAAPAAPASDDAFDIARELAEELGGEAPPAPAADDFQYSVEDVFSQFKKGVAETVKAEDSATHYDLGIAYKEMGLLDDAVHEFETALRGNDRKREVDCLSMIGLCHTLKGDRRAAIEAFRRALGSDFLTKDAAKALHFELGEAHEGAGETDAALWYFHKVEKADAAFRDVAARIRALGGGPGRAPPDAARAAAAARPPPPAAPPAPAKKNIGYL